MITLQQIQSRFKKRLPRKFVREISKYINESVPQAYLKKALNYELSDDDCKALHEIGHHKGQYPKLYYLCCIYIHPLTIAQYVVEGLEKLNQGVLL